MLAPTTTNATCTASPHLRRSSAIPMAVPRPSTTKLTETTSSTGSPSSQSRPRP
ncbi:hypothetical protein D3C74_487780 [compost metagenome]